MTFEGKDYSIVAVARRESDARDLKRHTPGSVYRIWKRKWVVAVPKPEPLPEYLLK